MISVCRKDSSIPLKKSYFFLFKIIICVYSFLCTFLIEIELHHFSPFSRETSVCTWALNLLGWFKFYPQSWKLQGWLYLSSGYFRRQPRPRFLAKQKQDAEELMWDLLKATSWKAQGAFVRVLIQRFCTNIKQNIQIFNRDVQNDRNVPICSWLARP